MKIELVDAFKLFPDEQNVRQLGGVPSELVESIRQQGIIEPLVAREIDGKLHVVAGCRRMQAAQELGLKEVPVIVRELSDFQALGLSLQENLQRKDLSSIETADAIASAWEMLDADGMKAEEKYQTIDKQFGIKQAQVYKYLQMNKLSPELKEKSLQQDVNDADVLAEVSNEKDWSDEDKAEAIEVLGEVPTTTERRELVKELREKAEDGLSPREAFEQLQEEKKEDAPETEKWRYAFRIRRSVKSRFFEKCKELQKQPEAVVVELIERWL